jgi:hypothetical protein
MADSKPGPRSHNDRYDEDLRREFADLVGVAEPAVDVLERLTPAFRRARRRRQIRQGALTVAASVIVIGVVGATARLMLDDEVRVTVAGTIEPFGLTEQSGEIELAGNVVHSDPTEALVVSGTTTTTIERADAGSESDFEGNDAPESDSDDRRSSSSDSDAEGSEESAGGAGDETAATTLPEGDKDKSRDKQDRNGRSDRPDDDDSSVSKPEADGSAPTDDGDAEDPETDTSRIVPVESRCGSIGIEVGHSSVRLVEVLPRPGVDHKVKSAGPERVEVVFESDDVRCEIEARVRDGELDIRLDHERK